MGIVSRVLVRWGQRFVCSAPSPFPPPLGRSIDIPCDTAPASLLRLDGGRGGFCNGHVRLGFGFLWPVDLPQNRARCARLVAGFDLCRGHSAFSVWRGGDCEFATFACPIWFAQGDAGRRGAAGPGCGRLGICPNALAVVAGHGFFGLRLGGDGCGGDQRLGVTLVCGAAAPRTGHGLQRREHRWRDFFAAVGGVDFSLRFSSGRHRPGRHHGRCRGRVGAHRAGAFAAK